MSDAGGMPEGSNPFSYYTFSAVRGRWKKNGGGCWRNCRKVEKAVRWGVMGFGAPSSGDMGAPAEWLSGNVGYAGVKR
ncbi:hypothetical protein [Gabonibacter chumensis]|uniref:hypothetical protein n=1 Tax=Gabonibacter chumensis TaxID=2972474 RepID=UPI002573505C|nr:hypothetical protein [Gabonibacter chumensis]MCR9011031.1 hypothetical protein [Gabonibacter chumensis]